MELGFTYSFGQTPISHEEREGLCIQTISTRGELDEFEQENIQSAVEWTLKQKFTKEKILTIDFIKTVHKQMFNQVWKWAGKFRTSNKNLGVDKSRIIEELKILLDDCQYWIEHRTYPPDEIAIRFKHRMVSIHPFPNGNGRHSRLCSDIVISHVFNERVFSWGALHLASTVESRQHYLNTIRKADEGDIEPLLRFARS